MLLAAIIMALGCHSQRAPATRAFYYWRTVFNPSAAELRLIESQHVNRMYLRVFDVAWSDAEGDAVPVARCSFDQPVPDAIEFVPVVFLKNDVFLHAPDAERLAERVWALARATAEEAEAAFTEIQTDCDWTDKSRAAYFAYCRELRKLAAASGAKVSATIRLHQVKYQHRTGVPPVDRGMLMFYNMGRLEDAAQRSAIYNSADAQRYVRNLDDYPLPMDVALPVFGWGIHWRDGRVIDLMAKLDDRQLTELPAVRAISAHAFLADQPTFLNGTYLQKGDSITMDVVTPDVAREAAKLLAGHFHPRAPFTVALFDLDERNFTDYAPEDFNYLFSCVR